tara:strand:- start:519 stop:1994 length:1476 start_codon:yes stop_codon:yes gene_type:complete
MTTLSRFRRAGAWQLSQIFVNVVAQFLYIGVMARLLSKSDFGLMAVAAGFIGIGVVFSEGGMGAALIQRKEITQQHMNAALHGAVIFGFVFYALLITFSKSIAGFFGSPELIQMLYVVGLIIMLNSVAGIFMSLLHKSFSFHKAAPISMLSTIVGYLSGVYFAFNGLGVWSLVWASLIIALINTVGYYSLSPVKLSLRFYKKEWAELFSFSSGMILLKIANYFNDTGLKLVVAKFLSLEMLGVFERATKLKSIPSMHFGNLLDSIMFPAMSEVQEQEDKLAKMYQYALGVSNSLMIPGACFLIFYAREIVVILLGNQWHEIVLPFQIMAAALPFAMSTRMTDALVRAKGLVYKNVTRKYAFVMVLIASSIAGAYYFGVVGVAVAVFISQIFNYLTMVLLVKKLFGNGFIDTFLRPLMEGAKLAAFVLIFIQLLDALARLFDIPSIPSFLVTSFLLLSIVGAFGRWRPYFLGCYLSKFLIHIFNKDKAPAYK